MMQDFSWTRSAEAYRDLYRRARSLKLTGRPITCQLLPIPPAIHSEERFYENEIVAGIAHWSSSLLLLFGGSGWAQESGPNVGESPEAVEEALADQIQRFTATVDATDDVGSHVSVALHPDSGVPYISYYDADKGDLRMAVYVTSGGNCGPNNAWECQTVDSNGDVGQYSSIAIYTSHDPIILGRTRVGISYYDATNGALKYALYTWNLLTGWRWSYSVLEVGNPASLITSGRHTSLTFDADGAPHIAYRHSSILVSSLRYATFVGSSAGNCGPGNNWQCDCG